MSTIVRLLAVGTANAALVMGCASGPAVPLDERRAQVESEIDEWGLATHPAIEAQRAEIDAAVAREDESPVVDGIEVRAAAVNEVDTKAVMLVRLPIENVFGAHAQREARRAQSDAELARLEEVTLQQRVQFCLPSLDRLVYAERVRIFERYAERQRALLDHNRRMQEAGRVDEVGAAQFELAGQVGLARREPAPLPPALRLGPAQGAPPVLAVLPDPAVHDDALVAEPEVVRSQLLRYRPAVDVHRALGRSYQERARRERINRYPTLRFVDLGFEPVAYPGDERQFAARISVEVPFGIEARAQERRYQALAHGQRSAERALIDDGVHATRVALDAVNHFRSRGGEWLGLLDRADRAERIADRWREGRMADPAAISRLLEEVYDARVAVLDARERAGIAGCSVLASSGLSVDQWPR